MAVDVRVPSVGESITEGTLVRWLKKEGAPIRADEPLFELETEKATSEVPAPAAGVLKIMVREGQTVAIGAVVGQIDESAAPAATPGSEKRKPVAARAAPRSNDEPVGSAPETGSSPAARRLAEEHGVNLHEVTPTGRGGRVVTKEDVLTRLEQQERTASTEAAPIPLPPAPPPSMPAPAGRETRQRMSPIRQRIAERLLASQQNAAILTTFNEADLSAVLDLRAKYKERFKEKHGVSLGFMPFFVKACVAALQAYPVVNARIDGADVVYHHDCNIGIAVSTEKGLMVPVLRGADRMSIAEIDRQIAELAGRARDGKITVNDLQGGTFTITNGGVFGSLLSTPILNPPQSAILGMHAIQKRPVAVNDQVVIRSMMYLALSYDHRLIDGREAVLFLVRVKECVEAPERLLLEV